MTIETRHPIAEEFQEMCNDGYLPVFEIGYEAAGTVWYMVVDMSIYDDTVYLEMDNLGVPYFSGDWEVHHRHDVTHIVAKTDINNFWNLSDLLEEAYAECIQYIADCGFTLAEE